MIKTLLVSIVIFSILFLYVSIRHQQLSFYTANKAAAGVVGILLGLVVMTGPLSRIYSKTGFLMIYRKWFGIHSFLFGYIHGMISLFFLPSYFPLSQFTTRNTAFIFASLSLLILIGLFILSFDVFIKHIEHKWWWHFQNWGVRLSFVFGLVHILFVKYPFWVRWFFGYERGIGRFFPPAGLIISAFLLYICCLRLFEMSGRNFAKRITPVFTVMFLVFVMSGIGGGVLANISKP